MFNLIKELLTSKKFVSALAGMIAAAILRLGLEIPVEDIAAILSPLLVYILGQGWADTGKEAAKIGLGGEL